MIRLFFNLLVPGAHYVWPLSGHQALKGQWSPSSSSSLSLARNNGFHPFIKQSD